MSWYLTVASAAAFLLAPAGTLVRLETDDTIYILNGEQADLETFDAEVASTWTGGVLIEKDPGNGEYAYWAFADRTAQESRAFMIPAIVSGLALDIAAYDQTEAFPEERATLDELAVSCGAEEDPFFLTPLRKVRVLLTESVDATVGACLLQSLRGSEFGDMIETARGDNDPQELTPALTAEIESICDLPAGALTGNAAISDAMPKIACAVQEARKRNLTIGFISNPVAPDAQTH